jgi:hypothetical protein
MIGIAEIEPWLRSRLIRKTSTTTYAAHM